ncbi:MAG TPA: VOC family protein [Nitrospiria bacterium]|nr:VOC family protein [Nitrospiria bacterium]
MNFTLHHVAVQTANLDRALYFYRDLLGLPVIKSEVSPKGRKIVWLKAGNGRLELYGGKPGQALSSRWNEAGVGPLSLGFLVPDLDRTVSLLREAGVRVIKDPYEPVAGERAAMVGGPEGEEIVLLEKPVE